MNDSGINDALIEMVGELHARMEKRIQFKEHIKIINKNKNLLQPYEKEFLDSRKEEINRILLAPKT